MKRPFFQTKLIAGNPRMVRNWKITPQSRTVEIRWTGGGLLWNRPVALLVEQEGESRRLPIRDRTRLIQVVFFGLSVVFGLMTLMVALRE